MGMYYFVFKSGMIDDRLTLVSIYPPTPLLSDEEVGIFITDAVNKVYDSTNKMALYKAEWAGHGKLPDRLADMESVVWS